MLLMTPLSTRGLRRIYLRSAAWYTGFAVYAACVALFSGPGLDHMWGAWAVGGYAVAAAIAAWRPTLRGQYAALTVAVLGALVAPLIWLAVREPVTSDSLVVARSGVLLLHHGVPYLPAAQLAAGGWLAYNPYLPVMAVFGLPKAFGLPGLLGDPRPWLAAATFGVLYLTFRVTSRRLQARRGVAARSGAAYMTLPMTAVGLAAFLLASPIMAFPLAMSITDPPIIALMCLSLALITEPRHMLRAAVVMGVAAAMKYTAWPALLIIAVMVAARDGMLAAVKFTMAAVVSGFVLALAFAPAAFANLHAVLLNTVDYPLGLTSAHSPAQSPLPGHMLSELGSAGHAAALGLLAIAGLTLAASVVFAPPSTPRRAAIRIALGLAALFALGPASRFGYFVYPLALCAWAVLTSRRIPRLASFAGIPALTVARRPARPASPSGTSARRESGANR
jgi:hypothetical protein